MKKIFLLLLIAPLISFGQKEYAEEARLMFAEANFAYNKGNLTDAFALYEKCIGIEPQYAEAFVNMSFIKFDSKDYNKALDYALKAHSIEKVQHSIFSALGKSYYMVGDYDSAATYLAKIEYFDDLTEVEEYFLAASNVKLNNFSAAKPLAKKLYTNRPSNSDYAALKGNVMYGYGEYEQAMELYKKALDLNPDNVYIYSNIAKACLQLNQNDKALEYINKGVEIATGEGKVTFLILKGNYFHSIGELDNAEKAYDEAYKIDNSNTNILVNQAGILIDKEDYQSALEKCNMAIEKNSELMEAYFNRGIANEMLRNIEDACSDWEEAFILGSEKAEKFLNSSTCNE